MTNAEKIFEPIFDKAQAYTKTSCDLIKLQMLDKSASVGANIFSRLLLLSLTLLFIFSLSIAISLLIGEALGKTYYGFFIVTGFYFVASLVVYLIHPALKSCVNNFIIKQSQN